MTEADLAADGSAVAVRSVFIRASDGLQLHVRCYGIAAAQALPVVCLPGLSRNGSDFEPLARHLSANPAHPRAVFAFDYRGRGLSDRDPEWKNYNLVAELADVVTVLTTLDIRRAVFVGTSRGGLLTMLLAATQPAFVAGAILNDIGPVIEPAGLMRIKGYIGTMPVPKDVAEGADILRRIFGAQFPKLTDDEWAAWARRSWTQTPNGMVSRYDPNLAYTLADAGPDQPIPAMWEPFDALAPVPVMVIRGALSDLLSEETVAAMRARRPDLETIAVPDQGHAPLLSEPPVMAQLEAFIRRCDETTMPHAGGR